MSRLYTPLAALLVCAAALHALFVWARSHYEIDVFDGYAL